MLLYSVFKDSTSLSFYYSLKCITSKKSQKMVCLKQYLALLMGAHAYSQIHKVKIDEFWLKSPHSPFWDPLAKYNTDFIYTYSDNISWHKGQFIMISSIELIESPVPKSSTSSWLHCRCSSWLWKD